MFSFVLEPFCDEEEVQMIKLSLKAAYSLIVSQILSNIVSVFIRKLLMSSKVFHLYFTTLNVTWSCSEHLNSDKDCHCEGSNQAEHWEEREKTREGERASNSLCQRLLILSNLDWGIIKVVFMTWNSWNIAHHLVVWEAPSQVFPIVGCSFNVDAEVN